MRIAPRTHQVLDFVRVAVFAAAPTGFGFGGLAAIVAYGLAAVHLGLTLATRFSSAARRPVPIGLHAFVELMVGVMLLILPWLLGWPAAAQRFFLTTAVVILVIWLFSRYSEEKRKAG